jgi:hypothetical protein
MITKNKQLLEAIVDLERQLQELKLDLSSNDREPNYTDPLEVGEEVVILNPKKGQESNGVLDKIHQRTKRATIITTNKRGGKEKIVRLLINIRR